MTQKIVCDSQSEPMPLGAYRSKARYLASSQRCVQAPFGRRWLVVPEANQRSPGASYGVLGGSWGLWEGIEDRCLGVSGRDVWQTHIDLMTWQSMEPGFRMFEYFLGAGLSPPTPPYQGHPQCGIKWNEDMCRSPE